MRRLQHEAIARWERRWLNVAGLLLLLFVLLMAYSLATEGGHIAQRSGRAAPGALTDLALFKEPGVSLTNFGAGVTTQARVTMIAQMFSFTPSEVVVPLGAEVTFYLTSRDTIHGFQVERTNINVELIPGEISTLKYTFDTPGVYRTTCNEYCGGGHEMMMGRIRVVAPGTPPEKAVVAGSDTDRGQATFDANCAGCHQTDGAGMAGTFPPLAGHAGDLAAAERSYLPKVLLAGLEGPISVAGGTYDGQMPAWGQLSDEDLAAILNYIVRGWAEPAAEVEPYTAKEVADAREIPITAQDVYSLRQSLNLD